MTPEEPAMDNRRHRTPTDAQQCDRGCHPHARLHPSSFILHPSAFALSPMVRLFFYPVGESYFVVIVAAMVLLALLALGPARSKASPPRRLALSAIRLVIILLVLLAMLRPTLVYTETKKQAATVVLLVDATRSMSVPDAIGGKSRWETLQRAFYEAAPALAELGRDFEIKAYTFDVDLHPVEVDLADGKIHLPETPNGQQTAIGAALEDVLRFEAGKRLLGVVLLSDGAQRATAPHDAPPQTAAARMKQLGFPLFTIPFGQSRGLGEARDVAVKNLGVAEQVFVQNELEITGEIRVDGYVNREIPVRVLFETAPGKMEIVAQQTIRATSDGQLVPVKFTYAPQTAGQYKLTLDVVGQPGELVTTNNELSTFVNVLKGGLKVLYLEGERRVEGKFLRHALDASPDIKVDYEFLDPRHPEIRPHDIAERFKPGKYDAYILGDLDAKAFQGSELEDLAKAVSQGAGLIMLGGFHSFGPGGYASPPLDEVLPVVMDRLERQNLDEPPRGDLHVPGPLKMKPTDIIGERHFSMLLAPTQRESMALWDKLPPLEGANRFTRLKPGAVSLAAADGHPLLVAQSYGNGRVMAFAGDSTWHWWMQGFEAVHKRFWRQIALWLAKKDQSMEGNVWIQMDERRLAPGDRLNFTVGAQSPTGEPVEDFTASAEIVLPDGARRAVQLIRQDNNLAGFYRDTQVAGDYQVEVTAKKKDQVLGTARGRFLVYQQDLELDNASADTALLESLAAMTGGQVEAPEQLRQLVQRLTHQTARVDVQQETKKTFWDTWPFFLVLVGLLTAEWYLRKRWGLV
jgi:hypothetical protein